MHPLRAGQGLCHPAKESGSKASRSALTARSWVSSHRSSCINKSDGFKRLRRAPIPHASQAGSTSKKRESSIILPRVGVTSSFSHRRTALAVTPTSRPSLRKDRALARRSSRNRAEKERPKSPESPIDGDSDGGVVPGFVRSGELSNASASLVASTGERSGSAEALPVLPSRALLAGALPSGALPFIAPPVFLPRPPLPSSLLLP